MQELVNMQLVVDYVLFRIESPMAKEPSVPPTWPFFSGKWFTPQGRFLDWRAKGQGSPKLCRRRSHDNKGDNEYGSDKCGEHRETWLFNQLADERIGRSVFEN
jgi:hypothetical protein